MFGDEQKIIHGTYFSKQMVIFILTRWLLTHHAFKGLFSHRRHFPHLFLNSLLFFKYSGESRANSHGLNCAWYEMICSNHLRWMTILLLKLTLLYLLHCTFSIPSRGGSLKPASILPPTGKCLSMCGPFALSQPPTAHLEAPLPAGGMVKWSVGP